MSADGLTPEELKQNYDAKTISEARTFKTHGVGREAAIEFLKTPEGRLYRQRLIEAAPDTPILKIQERAIDHIASGRELPRMEMNTDALVKVVPKGTQPTPYTPFWAREADLDAAIREGKNLHEFFGLPVGSESAQYDVYRIHPKAPTEVWVSTVAPTSELDGQVKKPGGATQYLTPNRKLYTQGELIKTVDNRLHVPLREAEKPKAPEQDREPHAKASSAAHPELHPESRPRINAATLHGTAKVAGVAGAAYGVYDAKGQIDAAIDTARSNREQWIKGGEETANQAAKTVVTGAAAAVGSVPGAAAGALTSPVTGPVGPVAGGLITGGAAAYGAEKLYEESVLQRATRFVGGKAGDIGYDYISKEGRLLREVNGFKEDLSEARDPAERTRLQGQLDKASAAFNKEAERNNRYFEGRERIDQVWEKMHERIPNVDKDDVNAALARHIDAGKRPVDAVRGAFSDAVHEKYPRALHHEPLENYRALSNTQLSDKYRQYQGELAQDQRDVNTQRANTNSQNNVDQGWPKFMADRRQAGRVEDALNEQWRDRGHLNAIGEAMRERGMSLPMSLSPAQQRYHQQAQEQLGAGLRRSRMSEEHVGRVTAAAVSHAQAKAHGGPVQAFHLSHDGQRVAMIEKGGALSEYQVRDATAHPADQHLAQAQATAQTQRQHQQQQQQPSQVQTQDQSQGKTQAAASPVHVQEQPALSR